ncbi:MAG TPA: CoB--CoM heterodisulfide reductase iron-sulfur subunit B family protein [bacterium]|nr:CoB--CoM heterodisulfide reductase iron-sulfur subunit B family protein [bacterium]
MKSAFFLGCTIPVRAQNFEMATREVAKALGIELVDLPSAGCCGYPVRSVDAKRARLVAAAVLADAEAVSDSLLTICTACTGVLTETAHELSEDAELLTEVNEELAKVGKQYRGTVKVRHFARVLFEDVPPETITNKITVDLSNLRFACHYGCHYLKPHEAYKEFDSVENPQSLDKLVQLTGAQTVSYLGKKRCCGGACLAVDENLALAITKEKLDTIKKQKADGIVLICPFCSIMYDTNQKKIEKDFESVYSIPVLFYPQLLGLAFGMDPKNLGFQMNRVKTKELLDRIAQPVSS